MRNDSASCPSGSTVDTVHRAWSAVLAAVARILAPALPRGAAP